MKLKIIIPFLYVIALGCNNANVKPKDSKTIITKKTTVDKIWYHTNAEKIEGLMLGPFIHLDNGNILTVSETKSYISKDKGKTWSTYPIFKSEGSYLIRPERALINTKKGTVILAFANDVEKSNWQWDEVTHDSPGAILPTYAVRSLDGGKTWEEPQKLHDEWTGAIRDIIQTKNGSVIFTTMMMQHNPGHHSVLTYTSMDEGENWIRSNIIDLGGIGHHSGVTESTIEQLENGRIWMLMRTMWGKFWESYSYDEGLTWKEFNATEINASTAPGLLKRLSSGRLILIWNQIYPEGQNEYPLTGGKGQWSEVPASNHRKELSIMFSNDDGKTWSNPVVIAKDEKRLSYPYMFEVNPGELWITTWQGELRVKINEKDFI
jgi:predicted neuraminidase